MNWVRIASCSCALAGHPVVVAAGDAVACAAVPERVVAVEVLLARLDPPVDVVIVLVAADRERVCDVDVDAAERVDELLEALHVDEHVVLDRRGR